MQRGRSLASQTMCSIRIRGASGRYAIWRISSSLRRRAARMSAMPSSSASSPWATKTVGGGSTGIPTPIMSAHDSSTIVLRLLTTWCTMPSDFNKDTPSLPVRFSFRHYNGSGDIDAMLAVHNSCRERDRTDPHSVCHSLPNLNADAYARLVQDAPPSATLLAIEEDQVVAHAWMEVWGVEERLYLWRVWVTPRHRGLGLGTAMHRWGEARARALQEGDPRPAFHLANATDREQDAVALLHNEGYQLSFISP